MSRMPAGIQAGRGLVEDQQARTAQQRGGDAQALAHAVGVAADAVPARGRQLDGLQHLADPPARRRRRRARRAVRGSCGRSGRGRSGAPPRTRRRPRSARAPSRIGSRPNSSHRALRRRDQPERHAQRGRLAGAVGTEEAVHVAGSDVQVDVVDREDLLVALDQPARADRRRRPTFSGGRHATGLGDRLDRAGRDRSGEQIAHARALER